MIEQRDKKVLIDIFFHKNKTAYLNQVMEAIPFVRELDFSFWDNSEFLRWQLLRLNKVYQEDVCKVWKKYLRCEDIKRRSAIVDFFFSFGEILPHPQASFMDWVEAQSDPGESFFSEEEISRDRQVQMELLKLISEKREITIEDLERRFEWFKQNWEEKVIEELMMMNPLPIPWIFRFPSPNDIASLPIFPGKGKKLKGRPPNWAENLLVYELSQAGMKNMEIARLLFGVDKSTEYRPDSPKHPILVKIAKTKEAMKKIVLESFPL